MRLPHSLSLAVLALSIVTFASAQTANDQAAALIEKNEFMAAERLVEPLATVKKPDARSLYQLGQIRTAQQRSEEAVKLLERAIKLDSSKPEYFSQLGKALGDHAGDVGDSFLYSPMRKALEKSISLDPNHLPGLIGLVRFYGNATRATGGDFKKAREYADRVAKIDPAQGAFEHGALSLRLNKVAEAAQYYEKSIALKPDNADAHLYYGYALQRLDRKAEARVQYELAVKLKPSFTEAKNALTEINSAPPVVR